MLNLQRKSDLFFESLPSYHNDYLDVGDGHKIYYEQYGNPNGKPILFLHGGPGAGFSNSHKGFFDPKLFRVIFFDQRGCLLYTSPSPRDATLSRMPSSA